MFGSGVCPELFGAPNRDPDPRENVGGSYPAMKKQEEELSFEFGGNFNFGQLRGKNLFQKKKKKNLYAPVFHDPFLTICGSHHVVSYEKLYIVYFLVYMPCLVQYMSFTSMWDSDANRYVILTRNM